MPGSARRYFPYIIAIGMAITGAHIAWKSYRGGDEVIDEVEPTDWKSVGIIVAGLIAHMNLLKPLGLCASRDSFFS